MTDRELDAAIAEKVCGVLTWEKSGALAIIPAQPWR